MTLVRWRHEYSVGAESMPEVTEYWAVKQGLLLLIVLFGRSGITGPRGRRSRD